MFPYFDRSDICEAYKVFEIDWHSGGWLQERPSNQRRYEATSIQLARMGFESPCVWTYDDLTENGRAIYDELARTYGLMECAS